MCSNGCGCAVHSICAYRIPEEAAPVHMEVLPGCLAGQVLVLYVGSTIPPQVLVKLRMAEAVSQKPLEPLINSASLINARHIHITVNAVRSECRSASRSESRICISFEPPGSWFQITPTFHTFQLTCHGKLSPTTSVWLEILCCQTGARTARTEA